MSVNWRGTATGPAIVIRPAVVGIISSKGGAAESSHSDAVPYRIIPQASRDLMRMLDRVVGQLFPLNAGRPQS